MQKPKVDPASKAEDEGRTWRPMLGSSGDWISPGFWRGTSSDLAWENRVVGLKKLEAAHGIVFCLFLTDGWILLFFCDPPK